MKKSDSFYGNERAGKLVADAEDCLTRCEWSAADNLFTQAISIDETSASRIAYGVSLSQQERYNEAISVFTPVLDGSDYKAIGVVNHNLAAIYRDLGDFDLARRFQWRSMLLQQNAGPVDLLGMANEAILEGRHEVAESLMLTACETDDGSFDDQPDGDFVATEGLITGAINSQEEGLILLFAAYRRHQAVRDFRGMGIDLLNMAQLFGDVKRFRAERACLVRAIRCFERAVAPYSLNKAIHRLAQYDCMQSVRTFDVRRN